MEGRTAWRVRPAGEGDAGALARLLTDFNGTPVDAAAALRRLRAAAGVETALVAEADGGRVVGFASVRVVPYLSDDRPYAELTELYVAPAWRRRGVARALLAAAEALARARGAGQLIVLTGLDNAPAQALYRAAGFADYALALRKRL